MSPASTKKKEKQKKDSMVEQMTQEALADKKKILIYLPYFLRAL